MLNVRGFFTLILAVSLFTTTLTPAVSANHSLSTQPCNQELVQATEMERSEIQQGPAYDGHIEAGTYVDSNPYIVETGKKSELNSTEVAPDIAPQVVYLIYTGFIQVVRTGVKIYNKLCDDVEDGVEEAYGLSSDYSRQVLRSWTVATGKTVTLTFGTCSGIGMTHILARHVPDYYLGYVTYPQTFFDPGTQPKTLEAFISNTINANKSKIAQYGFTSAGVVVYGNYWDYNKPVLLVIKNGTVYTVYPDGWGTSADDRGV